MMRGLAGEGCFSVLRCIIDRLRRRLLKEIGDLTVSISIAPSSSAGKSLAAASFHDDIQMAISFEYKNPVRLFQAAQLMAISG